MLASLRTTVIGKRAAVDLELFGSAASVETLAPIDGRKVFFIGHGFVETPIYAREALGCDARIEGPAIIVQRDTTTLVDPGAQAKVDGLGNLIIDVG